MYASMTSGTQWPAYIWSKASTRKRSRKGWGTRPSPSPWTFTRIACPVFRKPRPRSSMRRWNGQQYLSEVARAGVVPPPPLASARPSWDFVGNGGWTEATNEKGRGSNEPRPSPTALWLLGDVAVGFTPGCYVQSGSGPGEPRSSPSMTHFAETPFSCMPFFPSACLA